MKLPAYFTLPVDDQAELSTGEPAPGSKLWNQFNNELMLRAVVKHITTTHPHLVEQAHQRLQSLPVDR